MQDAVSGACKVQQRSKILYSWSSDTSSSTVPSLENSPGSLQTPSRRKASWSHLSSCRAFGPKLRARFRVAAAAAATTSSNSPASTAALSPAASDSAVQLAEVAEATREASSSVGSRAFTQKSAQQRQSEEKHAFSSAQFVSTQRRTKTGEVP